MSASHATKLLFLVAAEAHRVLQPGVGTHCVRVHGHHGQAAVAQHAAGTGGPAQITRID